MHKPAGPPRFLKIAAVLAAAAFADGFAADPAAPAAPAAAGPGSIVVPPVTSAIEAPQDIAVDPEDGSLWITTALGGGILHYSADLRHLGTLSTPFEDSLELTGIACRSDAGTLLVLNPVREEVREIRKEDGAPTGLSILLPLFSIAGLDPHPFPQGMGWQPRDTAGRESIWVLEPRFGAVYRVGIDGSLLGWFCHPSYPLSCDPANARAIPTPCLDVRLGKGGEILGLDLGAGAARTESILRVDADGVPEGIRTDVLEAGGTLGGMARGEAIDPRTGLPVPVFYLAVQSSAELLAVSAEEPPIREVLDLHCASSGRDISLTWKNGEAYPQGIEVFRDGTLLAALAGFETAFQDHPAAAGAYEYRVAGRKGEASSAASCRVLIGAGQVLHLARFEGRIAVDIAEDHREILYITDFENRIFVYSKELVLLDEIPSPFDGPEARLSGIAFNPAARSLLVYNFESNEIAEITLQGEVIEPPFPSGLEPPSPDDPPAVGSMLFIPGGAAGQDSFLYYELYTTELRRLTRAGEVLRRCPHPDAARDPVPADSPILPLGSGMSPDPESGFDRIDIAAGTPHDGQITRIVRLDAAGCGPTGFEVPFTGIYQAIGGAPIYQAGIHNTTHDGKPVCYVVKSLPTPALLMEISREEPEPLPPADLSCRQTGIPDAVRIAFTPHGPYEALELWRDGALLHALSPDSREAFDAGAAPGHHSYFLKASRGASASRSVECSLRVGPGAVLEASLTYPGTLFSAMTRNPRDGSFLCTSTANPISDRVFTYRPDLGFAGDRPAAFGQPFQIAGLAYRIDPAGKASLYSMGWNPGKPPGEQREFPIRIEDAAGGPARTIVTRIPVDSEIFVSFPAGLTWDSSDDTFWYLERNTQRIIHIDPEGAVLEHFPNPSHPHQDGVFNFGLWADGERGLLYLTSAGRRDFMITSIVELTRQGVLTGTAIPLDTLFYREHTGFVVEGTTAVVQSRRGSAPDLARIKMFEDLEPPRRLRASTVLREVRLEWDGDPRADGFEVWRSIAGAAGEVLARLPAGSGRYTDADLPIETHATYRVRGKLGPGFGPGAALTVSAARTFIRGDVDGNGSLDITDAIAILQHLFLGGARPACLDAADLEDDGAVEINDPILLLTHLFITPSPPAPPFPEAGLDPTADSLPCD